MLNHIWLALILLAVLLGGFGGKLKEVVGGAVSGAETAVTLALGLIGVMTLWLGVMRLAEKSGLVQSLARWLRPVMRRLFPDVPVDHPAIGSMVMNIAANMLGLTNAATPLGLRAMRDLESLNPCPGTATNAMCTFLAINTGSVQLIPITAVALLAGAGSKNPSAIIGTAFLATICSSAAGIVAVKLLEKARAFRAPEAPGLATSSPAAATPSTAGPAAAENYSKNEPPELAPMPQWGWWMLVLFVGCFAWFFFVNSFPELVGRAAMPDEQTENGWVRSVNTLSLLAIPFLLSFCPLYAALRRLKVYEEFVEGAKEGFQVAVRIIPFLVTMLVAIGMFRSAGGIDQLTRLLKPALDLIHFPPELLPMALMRPLSGSGSFAILSELVKQFGPDHLLVRTAGTLYGSTETTFYVIAVYFGAVSVRRTRHAVPAGLIADAVGIAASVLICRWAFT
jgi:spore maturation protein SpmA